MANGRANLLSRLAGIERIEDRLNDQDRRSEERHRSNQDTLAEIKQTTEAIDGRVTTVEKRTEIIEDRAGQIAKHRARVLSWRQGLAVSLVSGSGTTLLVLAFTHTI